MAAAPGGPDLVSALRARLPEMLTALEALVNCESPSSDLECARRCALTLSDISAAVLSVRPQLIDRDGRPHLRWRWGRPRVLVLGHLDTVWPQGTTAIRPFRRSGAVATGPGVFDMKAGIVQALFALASLPGADGVEMLITSDEEIGSATSRGIVEDAARAAGVVLVLEPSAEGALKTERKGNALYRITVSGRAAHAGLEPDAGVNALIEMAEQVRAVAAIARPAAGISVTPGVAVAGTTANTVPDRAHFTVDVRAWTTAELERVDRTLRALAPATPGASVAVEGGIDRPPLESDASAALYGRARAHARRLGLEPPGQAAVGGGSDGNLTAALAIPTLDGLGAVGAGAHAPDERVEIARIPERAALVAGLVGELSRRPAGLDDLMAGAG